MSAAISLVCPTPETWAYVACRSGVQPEEIRRTIEHAFAQLTEAIARGGVRAKGAPRAHYHYRDGAETGFELGFPIVADDASAAKRAGLGVGQTFSGNAFSMVHEGPYAELSKAYKRLEQELSAQGFSGSGDTWEVYLNDPDNTPPAELRTQIYWPIAEPLGA